MLHPETISDGRDRMIVLLVDDQRFVGVAVGQLLSAEPGVEFHHCCEAVDAVATANRVGPHVILQDLLMPDIDGLTLVRQFRANPTTASVPVIVLSGNDDVATRAQALAEGAADYLVKLPPKADLIACIRRHVGRRALSDIPGGPAPSRAQAASDQVLDQSVLEVFREATSPGFVRSLIGQFIDEAAGRIETLLGAANRGSAHTAKAAAHALKGSSLTIGAIRLADLCSQVEACTTTPLHGATLSTLVAAIAQEFDLVREALRAESGDPSPR
jgi:DNA-binding response OmpR family regulator